VELKPPARVVMRCKISRQRCHAVRATRPHTYVCHFGPPGGARFTLLPSSNVWTFALIKPLLGQPTPIYQRQLHHARPGYIRQDTTL